MIQTSTLGLGRFPISVTGKRHLKRSHNNDALRNAQESNINGTEEKR